MRRDAAAAHAPPVSPAGAADSPTLRLFALLEHIAAHDRLFSLQSLVEDTGWPKPSVHRMLQQLESGGLVQREGDSRHYSTGLRLRRFAEGRPLEAYQLLDSADAVREQLGDSWVDVALRPLVEAAAQTEPPAVAASAPAVEAAPAAETAEN